VKNLLKKLKKTFPAKGLSRKILISSIFLLIAAILTWVAAAYDLSPIFRFAGVLEVLLACVISLNAMMMLRGEENLEISTFLALCIGLTVTLYTYGSKLIGPLFFAGILTLAAGMIGIYTFKPTRKAIWLRRIKGFWFEYSHNKIGLVGLGILIIFIFVAIFQEPIAALSYPDPETPELAEHFAKPSWIGLIDPSASKFPPTLRYDLYWTVYNITLPEGVSIIQETDKWIIHYTGSKEIVVVLNTSFEYPYDPPFRASYVFSWSANPEIVGTIRYSIEINLTTPSGKVYPLWDQHWWKYKAAVCTERNPKPPPIYYPGGRDYEDYYQNKPYPWSPINYSNIRPAYGIYADKYGGKIPTWTAKQPEEIVDYSVSRYPPIRLGYPEFETKKMIRDLFSPSGTFKLYAYITFVPLARNATCEITISKMTINVPGLVWGLLGTDYMGRDCWARLVYGARVSIAVGIAAALIGTIVGLLVGIVAGYTGGLVDESIMRLVDIMLCIPVLPLLMALVTFFGRNIMYIILIIAVFGWQGLSRLIRSQVLSLREMAFIESAIASGANRAYIMIRHLIPNVLPVALADFILSVPGAILFEAALSYIGFGDPTTPTWGREYSIMQEVGGIYDPSTGVYWWWFLPPGLAITLLCIAFVFVGHAVDEIVNPRLRRRR